MITQQSEMMLIITVCLILLLKVDAQSSDFTNDSMATPVFENSSLATANSMNITCVSYMPTGDCENITLFYDYPVKFALNTSRAVDISYYQNTADVFHNELQALNPPKRCLELLEQFICRWAFATCDPAFNASVIQRVCKRGCDILSTIVCPETWETVIAQSSNLNFMVLDPPACDSLPYANGGDAPDCTDPTDGGEIPVFSQKSECFNGRGRGYNGTINVTRLGKTCQHWNVQAPHQFILPFRQYPELAGDHNYCRNPGSKGPDGPWCFTTDPDTRWEYCNVPNCGEVPSCQLYYNSPEAVCYSYGSIGRDYVFLNSTKSTDIVKLNHDLNNFLTALKANGDDRFPAECVDLIFALTCHDSLQLCNYNSSTPQPRKICRSYCEEISRGKCSDFWNEMNLLAGAQIISLPDCETLPSPEGGDYLECFIPYNSGRVRSNITSAECYNEDDRGIHYNGTISNTISSWTCQAWDSQTPHFHPLTSLYRPYLQDHNYCRNPEGRGSRPWCYTIDPNVRWEYCNIPLCSASSTTGNNDDEDNNVLIVAVVVPLLLLFVLMLILVLFILRTMSKRRKNKPSRKLGTDNHTPTKALPNKYITYPPIVTDADNLPNIPRENITYVQDLGEGNFGMVVKGEAKNIIPGQFSTLVAVKVLKEGSDSKARNDFVHEAVLVNQFDHPNILRLLGVCFEEEPFCIAFEYMELGDLNKYLRNKAISVSQPKSNITTQQIVDMAINIAAGLEYLAGRHFVHRDLATRNCLINQQLFVKISDFGLSKDIYSKDYYRLGDKSVLPIRWMPPEAIVYSKFSKQSDIWSFGIVLWEIFSSGAQPYYTLSNEEVIEYVSDEKVLRCPSDCPSEIYDLMVDCWATNPEDRPTAADLHTALKNWSPQLSAKHAAANQNAPPVDEYVKMESAKNACEQSSVLYASNNGSVVLDRETFV